MNNHQILLKDHCNPPQYLLLQHSLDKYYEIYYYELRFDQKNSLP